MKPVSKYDFPFTIPQRAIHFTAICVVSTALAACGGSGGGTVDGGSETQDLFTDSTDTDGDGLTDQEETDIGTDPNDPSDATGDLDGDGISNLDEIVAGTNPNSQDSDQDGLFDNEETLIGTDPLDATDADGDLDGDGVSNYQEVIDGTDPNDATDFDDSGETTEIASSCEDPDSSDSDWGNNCQLSTASDYAVSSYVQGVQRILWCQDPTIGSSFEGFADGIFGPNTARSVTDYQTANNLLVDGIVGPQTWGSLRTKLNAVAGGDVVIDGVTYAPYYIFGCSPTIAQFYQEVDGLDEFGWKMAATPGTLELVDFSTGAPN